MYLRFSIKTFDMKIVHIGVYAKKKLENVYNQNIYYYIVSRYLKIKKNSITNHDGCFEFTFCRRNSKNIISLKSQYLTRIIKFVFHFIPLSSLCLNFTHLDIKICN